MIDLPQRQESLVTTIHINKLLQNTGGVYMYINKPLPPQDGDMSVHSICGL
jgi:hypothetical protein